MERYSHPRPFASSPARGAGLPIREELKRQIYGCGESDPGCRAHFDKSLPCVSDPWGVSDVYFLLDSHEKTLDSRPGQGRLRFNLGVLGESDTRMIEVRSPLSGLIELQVSPFCLPLLADFTYTSNASHGTGGLPVLAAPSGTLPTVSQTAHCGRVTLYFPELGRQARTSPAGPYHFEFRAAVAADGARLELTPVEGCDTFVFTDPIRDVKELTAVFRGPDLPLELPADVLHGVALASTLTAGFFDLDPRGQSHNLAPGDLFFVRRAATADPVLNRYLNRAKGLVAGPATAADGNVDFDPRIGTAGSAPPPYASATAIDLYISKNRVRLPLRARRLVDRLTNYISP